MFHFKLIHPFVIVTIQMIESKANAQLLIFFNVYKENCIFKRFHSVNKLSEWKSSSLFLISSSTAANHAVKLHIQHIPNYYLYTIICLL